MGSTKDRSETKVCVVCDVEIGRGAIKCPNCGTFQNWRRHLQFSTTVLSLLIALISVSALVLPTILDALFEGARLHVELDRWNGHFSGGGGGKPGKYSRGLTQFEITGVLMVSNSGNRDAYLRSVRIELRLVDGPSGLTIGGESSPLPFTKTIQGEIASGMDIAAGSIYFAEFKVFDDIGVSYPVTDKEWNAHKKFPLDFTGSKIVVELVRHDLSKEEFSVPLSFSYGKKD